MLTVAQVLAQNNFGDTRTGGLAGPMGLFLILVLGTATVLLIRNMNARLRRLPDRFPTEESAAEPHRLEQTVGDPTDGTEPVDSSGDRAKGFQQGRDA
ncbi:hypothetical protein [Micromonospora endophytica]|uniref:Uncharacterized protein n=1 Tax=Micromonospora endophytica TaxID=515350 RepID=A0A2W2DIU7_9ACTN|nr:hypothetical protein [Micromonospora endophytica]PZF99657.1 hypothetical protein C1I93_05040 [Micromonospora endophytica]RIW45381.1 hypothetical protein D3H59_14915 [Micromonospora endophytica]BCJ58502.1 hypothetical protein Jiend_19240 [Micromonospora endophytica]